MPHLEAIALKVILGSVLDSGAYPDASGTEEAALGTVITGFRGLIGILLTQLGLARPESSEVERIARWEQAISSWLTSDNAKPSQLGQSQGTAAPFAASFAADAWGTARELLQRRDELVLAGWDPRVHPEHREGPGLLQALAALESATVDVAPGFADDVRAVRRALEQITTPFVRITELELVDENPSMWEPWCRQLVELLAERGTTVRLRAEIEAKPVHHPASDESKPLSDLALLQAVQAGLLPPQRARGDGSVLLIKGAQEWEVADAFCTWLERPAVGRAVVIRGSGSAVLDDALHRRGMPAVGVDTSSKWRAVLQVLPLTLETYWNPLLIDRMLALLSLPVSPIPGQIRYRLARALTDEPGIGGPAWTQAMEDALAHYEEGWRDDGLADREIQRRRQNLITQLDLYIHHARYDMEAGLPSAEIVQVCQGVASWAALQFDSTGEVLYLTVVAQARQVMDGILALADGRIPRLQLSRVLKSVAQGGARLPEAEREASPWRVVDHPGQLWDEADSVLWWGFHQIDAGARPRPFTSGEVAWLASRGVDLQSPASQRRHEAHLAARAVQMAKGQLVLFAPLAVAGAAMAVHSLWDEICTAIAPDAQTERLLQFDASVLRRRLDVPWPDAMESGTPVLGRQRKPVTAKVVPLPQREWQARTAALGLREVESATSLEMLLGCPLRWVLSYQLGIRQARVLAVPTLSQMQGTLAHEVLRQVLARVVAEDIQSESEIRRISGELYDALVPQLAAPLLEPQNTVTRQEARRLLQQALVRFASWTEELGVTITHSEHTLRKPWANDVAIEARLDLVGTTSAGLPLLIDAKWSNHTRRYRERLQNLSVQLTLYHYLLSSESFQDLPVAYFMLKTGEFFTSRHPAIPEHFWEDGPSLRDALLVLKKTIDEELRQLAEGVVTAKGIPEARPDELVQPPCSFCEYQHLCGLQRVKW